jgi:hypothetical protein
LVHTTAYHCNGMCPLNALTAGAITPQLSRQASRRTYSKSRAGILAHVRGRVPVMPLLPKSLKAEHRGNFESSKKVEGELYRIDCTVIDCALMVR